MDRDGGLSEKERQDAEREADHQARRDRLAGGTAVSNEGTVQPAPAPKPKTASRKTASRKTARARAKSSSKKS